MESLQKWIVKKTKILHSLVSLPNICNCKLVQNIFGGIEVKGNQTKFHRLIRGQGQEVQCTRTLILSLIITELFPFLLLDKLVWRISMTVLRGINETSVHC